MSLDTWGIKTPTVAPEHLYDHEVIVEGLMFAHIGCGFEVVAGLSSKLDPLWVGSFNAVGRCYVLSYQAALMVRYTTALLSLAMSVFYVSGYKI